MKNIFWDIWRIIYFYNNSLVIEVTLYVTYLYEETFRNNECDVYRPNWYYLIQYYGLLVAYFPYYIVKVY